METNTNVYYFYCQPTMETNTNVSLQSINHLNKYMFELTMYHNGGDHVNNYTTDAVYNPVKSHK
jgi:hypothetical protein